MKPPRIIGFFHPFCDAMGGGEKVLYQALKAIQAERDFNDDTLLVYSGSSLAPEQLCSIVRKKFGTKINLERNNLQFIKLRSHDTMQSEKYPSWTLFWQAIAYNRVCFEALFSSGAPCDIFIDTIGVGFAYPLVKLLFGCRIISYTHYPTISSDMVNQIDTKLAAESSFKRMLKRLYYYALKFAYSKCGYFADAIATNSSWTDNHIRALWAQDAKTQLIYPPCDTQDLIDNDAEFKLERAPAMMSFAQFRPEKNHVEQLKIWKQALP